MTKNHIAELEKRLWDVADELRANSDLKSSEYSTPVLGLIFLKYADYCFSKQEKILSKKSCLRATHSGEFFTPTSIVKLIVSVIQPFHGKIYDPACGSGGMFVQSAKFVQEHKKRAMDEISIYGQEKTRETVNLCKMNLAVHGLSADILQANSYYEDLHDVVGLSACGYAQAGKFDFVMANP